MHSPKDDGMRPEQAAMQAAAEMCFDQTLKQEPRTVLQRSENPGSGHCQGLQRHHLKKI